MDDDDRPRGAWGQRSPDTDFGAASLLAGESLDSYSLDELDARTALLEAEVARVARHRQNAARHMSAADALFRSGRT